MNRLFEIKAIIALSTLLSALYIAFLNKFSPLAFFDGSGATFSILGFLLILAVSFFTKRLGQVHRWTFYLGILLFGRGLAHIILDWEKYQDQNAIYFSLSIALLPMLYCGVLSLASLAFKK